MGFEEFSVGLYPLESSPLHSGNTTESFSKLIEAVREKWPALHCDTVERERSFPSKAKAEEIFVSETAEGLFQVFFRLGNIRDDDVLTSVRFAYVNPRSVYEPVFGFIKWAMRTYNLYCYVVPDLAPEQAQDTQSIHDADNVRSILLPCIEYNRKLWQMDAGTEEEAILRPGEAVARFITPRLLPLISHSHNTD